MRLQSAFKSADGEILQHLLDRAPCAGLAVWLGAVVGFQAGQLQGEQGDEEDHELCLRWAESLTDRGMRHLQPGGGTAIFGQLAALNPGGGAAIGYRVAVVTRCLACPQTPRSGSGREPAVGGRAGLAGPELLRAARGRRDRGGVRGIGSRPAEGQSATGAAAVGVQEADRPLACCGGCREPDALAELNQAGGGKGRGAHGVGEQRAGRAGERRGTERL